MLSRRALAIAAGLGLIAAVIIASRQKDRPPRLRSAETSAESAESEEPAAASSALTNTTSSATPIAQRPTGNHVRGQIPWGKGRGQIVLPDEDESEGETTLRLAPAQDGETVFLDRDGARLLRMGPDGRINNEVGLPTRDARDVAVAKDGSLSILERTKQGEGSVMLLSPQGKSIAKLPLNGELARHARGVVVSGNDVYVESSRGELTRIGDVQGNADPSPSLAPGRPTRDGRGFLTALIANAETGAMHVFIVERSPRKQRFSRLVHLNGILVEGIFLIDTSAAGTIYLGVTGSERAQLLCLEPEHGEMIGIVDLPVKMPEEAILDAKALDGGGVTYSVHTKQGLRVESHDCE